MPDGEEAMETEIDDDAEDQEHVESAKQLQGKKTKGRRGKDKQKRRNLVATDAKKVFT